MTHLWLLSHSTAENPSRGIVRGPQYICGQPARKWVQHTIKSMRMLRRNDMEMDAGARYRLRRSKPEGCLRANNILTVGVRRSLDKSKQEKNAKQMAMPTGTQVATCMAEHCVSGMVKGEIVGSIASGHHDRPVLRWSRRVTRLEVELRRPPSFQSEG